MKNTVELSRMHIGESCIFQSCQCRNDTRLFLESLGFFPGIPLRVVGRSGKDLIVEILGTRLAMGGTLANGLYVTRQHGHISEPQRGQLLR